MRLKDRFDRYTTTGYGLCDKHKKEGFALFIEIDESKSEIDIKNGTVKPENAHKTGNNCYIKTEAAKEIFGDSVREVNYIDSKVMEFLKNIQKNNKEVDKTKKSN